MVRCCCGVPNCCCGTPLYEGAAEPFVGPLTESGAQEFTAAWCAATKAWNMRVGIMDRQMARFVGETTGATGGGGALGGGRLNMHANVIEVDNPIQIHLSQPVGGCSVRSSAFGATGAAGRGAGRGNGVGLSNRLGGRHASRAGLLPTSAKSSDSSENMAR